MRQGRGVGAVLGRRCLQAVAAKKPLDFPADITKVTTLPNGLRVATERVHAECETVTLGVWFDCGSRRETGVI